MCEDVAVGGGHPNLDLLGILALNPTIKNKYIGYGSEHDYVMQNNSRILKFEVPWILEQIFSCFFVIFKGPWLHLKFLNWFYIISDKR